MKGIMFTELVEMIETRYSPELADRVLSRIPSGGAYTAVGRYPIAEWQEIVSALSAETGLGARELVREFGVYLFASFRDLYADMVRGISDSFTLFETVQEYVHVEVRKLHPDAELPEFRSARPAAGTFVLDYSSPRPLADLAEGLIQGAISHFREDIDVVREDQPGGPPFRARFSMRRRA